MVETMLHVRSQEYNIIYGRQIHFVNASERPPELKELLEQLCRLFICVYFRPGKETVEIKGSTCPHSLGRRNNVYQWAEQREHEWKERRER